MEGSANVVERGLAPLGRRLAAVEGDVLPPREEVHHRARHAGGAGEVADSRGVVVDAADADELGLQVTHPGVGLVEALGAAAGATEEVGVVDGGVDLAVVLDHSAASSVIAMNSLFLISRKSAGMSTLIFRPPS